MQADAMRLSSAAELPHMTTCMDLNLPHSLFYLIFFRPERTA